MSPVDVRIAAAEELPVLVATLGQERFFSDRLSRQVRGLGELFVAWAGATPVGDVYLWREEPFEPEVREHLGSTPTVNHLEVAPVWQNQGVGTALLRAVEAHSARLGYRRIALGVGVDNPDARRLYERLGYVEWGHGLVVVEWDEPGPDGVLVHDSLTCHWLVRNILHSGLEPTTGPLGARGHWRDAAGSTRG